MDFQRVQRSYIAVSRLYFVRIPGKVAGREVSIDTTKKNAVKS